MALMTETLTQSLAIADVVDPRSNAAGTVNSLGIDMSKYGRCRYLLQIGTLTGTATVNATLQSSSTSNFASTATITSASFTATNSPNTTASFEIRADQVAQQNAGHRYVRLSIVSANNTAVYSAIGLAAPAYQKPGSDGNLNTTYIPSGNLVVCSS